MLIEMIYFVIGYIRIVMIYIKWIRVWIFLVKVNWGGVLFGVLMCGVGVLVFIFMFGNLIIFDIV